MKKAVKLLLVCLCIFCCFGCKSPRKQKGFKEESKIEPKAYYDGKNIFTLYNSDLDRYELYTFADGVLKRDYVGDDVSFIESVSGEGIYYENEKGECYYCDTNLEHHYISKGVFSWFSLDDSYLVLNGIDDKSLYVPFRLVKGLYESFGSIHCICKYSPSGKYVAFSKGELFTESTESFFHNVFFAKTIDDKVSDIISVTDSASVIYTKTEGDKTKLMCYGSGTTIELREDSSSNSFLNGRRIVLNCSGTELVFCDSTGTYFYEVGSTECIKLSSKRYTTVCGEYEYYDLGVSRAIDTFVGKIFIISGEYWFMNKDHKLIQIPDAKNMQIGKDLSTCVWYDGKYKKKSKDNIISELNDISGNVKALAFDADMKEYLYVDNSGDLHSAENVLADKVKDIGYFTVYNCFIGVTRDNRLFTVSGSKITMLDEDYDSMWILYPNRKIPEKYSNFANDVYLTYDRMIFLEKDGELRPLEI